MNDASQGSISKKYFRLAEVAYNTSKAVDGKAKLCAILLKGGRVVAKAVNNYTHARHAECAALGKLWPSDREGAILLVIRSRKSQQFGCALPCPDCMAFIRESKIKRVIYSTNDINSPLKELDMDTFTELDRARLAS